MQSSPAKPSFDELSPDLRYRLCQCRERREALVQLGAIAMTALLTMPMLLPPLNKQMDIALHEGRELKLFGITVYSVPPALEVIGFMPPDALQTIDKGDAIAGFTVTSGYGPRRSPCAGCSSDHRGVDLGTPIGTPIYAPAAKSSRVKVECFRDSGGGGLVANISSPDIADIKFQALHLSECATGLHAGGSIIARTGDTGNGTGPHLDWRQRDKATNEHQHPQKGFLVWTLTGQQPQTIKSLTEAETLQRAIGLAEGTRDRLGNPTAAYDGHSDPGNQKRNLGSFSYQHGASSPEEADQKWLAELEEAAEDINQQAIAKFEAPLSEAAMVVALDAYTQSPNAGSKYFIGHLPTNDPTSEQLQQARIDALNSSRAELGGPPMNVAADQKRRVNAVLDVLK